MTPRNALRAATHGAHEQLDALFSCLDLADPVDYRRFLKVHASVFPSCEATLSASCAADLLPDWPARIRAPSLEDDLWTVGVGAQRGRMQPEAPVEPAAAFGMMYVLEGSRLGGAVLARRVSANPDPLCREATRYLRHGSGLKLWPSFVCKLEAAECVRANLDGAVAGALTTFAQFIDAARLLQSDAQERVT